MKKIIIINGPNLNLLGKREVDIYGHQDFNSFFKSLTTIYSKNFHLEYFQSNIEGELIDKIQEFGFNCDGIILNAGAYTHTSVAIRDAISAINVSVVEVHISNIFAREEFRHVSILGSVCSGSISGFGLKSYNLALQSFI